MGSFAPKPPLRKLVSARCISQIKVLSSSETHEVVFVDSWPVVVPKGQFRMNEFVLYFEIDSFLPFREQRYDSYRSSQTSARLHGQMGWVVQTVKLAGHISQGMVFRIDDQFPEVDWARDKILQEGDFYDSWYVSEAEYLSAVDVCLKTKDLTDDFRVKRWHTFHRLDGGVDLGRPPSFLPDLELERAQNLRDLWKTHGNKEFEITEMLDGMPVTVYRVDRGGKAYSKLPGMLEDDKHFRKRSGLGISIGDHDYGDTEESISWAAMRCQGIIEALPLLPPLFSQPVLSGVLCGVGIFGNLHWINGRRFYVHCASDADSMESFNKEEVEKWRNRSRAFQLVPTKARRIRLSAFAQSIDELMMKAEGDGFVFNPEGNRRQPPKRKGLVFKALDGSLNFKAISNEWLLDETGKFRELGEDARRRPGPQDCV